MAANATVFVVDDDPGMRESLRFLVESVGLVVETFERAQDFFDNYDSDRPGCLVLDVRMPGVGGLELQERLQAIGAVIPVIMVTGYGDVPMAVRAMRAGAVDFIEKPFSDQHLLERIQEAIKRDNAVRGSTAKRAKLAARMDALTERERQVLHRVVAGKANKVIADELGLSQKTIEVHRSRLMQKMQAESVAELVALVLRHNAG